ncbi:MAG: hypothetical protein WCK28_17050 [Burkholderiales bacterium]|jgi:hypothetical protein
MATSRAAVRAAWLRQQHVARLERLAELYDVPEWWRIRANRVELGTRRADSRRIHWRPIPFLSAELLRREREYQQLPEIPF